jgi:hypothetical protein
MKKVRGEAGCELLRQFEYIIFFKALFTRDIFGHNIAIKRYWDKNIFLTIDFKTNQGKLLTKH